MEQENGIQLLDVEAAGNDEPISNINAVRIENNTQPINTIFTTITNDNNMPNDETIYSPQIQLPNTNIHLPNTIDFEKIIISCLCHLYGDFGLSRKDAQLIISQFFKSLIIPLINHFESLALPLLSSINKLTVCNELKNIQDIFTNVETYHLFVKYLKKIKGHFQEPAMKEINKNIGPIISNNEPILGDIVAYECLMPIKFQIKQFFELPRAF